MKDETIWLVMRATSTVATPVAWRLTVDEADQLCTRFRDEQPAFIRSHYFVMTLTNEEVPGAFEKDMLDKFLNGDPDSYDPS